MSVLPIVSPAHNADGIALMPTFTALYPFQLDEGSVSTVNCFLVKKVSYMGNNTTVPVPVKVSHKRVELLTLNEYTGLDYGSDEDAGLKYRSQIVIVPSSILNAHTEYSVILSKDIGKLSVYDVYPNVTNTSANIPLIKGPYTGLEADSYRVEVTIGGNENTATYKIVRDSDNDITLNLIAKKRYIEIEKGLFIKFPAGTYVAGDYYTVIVTPLVKTNEIYSWDFTTGDSEYTLPSDSNSGVIVGLPVEDSIPVVVDPLSPFKLVSISPVDNSIMNDPENKTVTFTFNKNIKPDSMTDEKIKIIAESTATNYYGSIDFTYAIDANKLIITFDEE
jgi:hypothetical protein